jgi:hypothetical protein
MKGQRWHHSDSAVKTARRAVESVLTLLVAFAGFASSASGQVTVHYGEGQYGAYRRDLANYGMRAGDLIEEIGKVDVVLKYCDPREREADGKKLAELRRRVAELRRDWIRFKQGVEAMVENQGVMRQFIGMDQNPKDPNFWSNADKEVLQHPQDDLNAKQRIWDASKVVDCYTPKTSSPPAPPVPPTVPPKKDPLAGLKRPHPKMQTLPAAPKPFCSEEEKWAWIRAVIRPLMTENIDASWALREYGGEVWDRLSAARAATPPDQDAIDKLDAELQWEFAEHKKWDDLFKAILKLMNSAVVIDCTQHVTTVGGTPTPPDTTHPRTRERPGTGTPPDTTFPRTRERPGTGAPSPVDTLPRTQEKPGTGAPQNEPAPKTGALPGGKHRGGEWIVGAGIDENWYQDFAHTAGDQANIETFTGKQTTPGWGVELGYSLAAWRFWMCRHVNRLHFTQQYTRGSLYSHIDGDLHGSFYDFRVERRVELRWNTYVEVFGGLTFAYDKLELTPVTPTGIPVSEILRDLETWKTNVGVAIERPLSRDFGWRAGFTYTGAGKSGDADANLRLGAGITYKLPVRLDF